MPRTPALRFPFPEHSGSRMGATIREPGRRPSMLEGVAAA